MKVLALPLLFLLCNFKSKVVAKDEFDESLSIVPLPDGQVYTHFKFITLWNQDLEKAPWSKLE